MRHSLLLCVALSATGCVERAFAQSAPRSDAGPLTDAGFRMTGPRDNPDLHRAMALSSLRNNSGLARIIADVADASVASERLEMGDTIGDSFGYGGLSATTTGTLGSTATQPDGGPAGTIGFGRMGRSAGTGSGSGYGAGMGGIGRTGTARVLRDEVATRGVGLSGDVVRSIMRRNITRFSACFERPIVPTPPEHARVVARFEIVRRPGGASSVVVATVEGAAPAINACVRIRLGTVRFPQPGTLGPIVVTYTLWV